VKKLQGLYAITDETLLPVDIFVDGVEQALKGGARIIQYRDKSGDQSKRLQQAGQIKELCQQYRAVFIINDDVMLAQKTGADGVHVGRDDASIIKARKILGENKIIGVSCYNQLKLAVQARNNGADYIAFGRFFSSKIKPDAAPAALDLLTQARALGLPVCAIGGIDQHNAGDLITAGADMVAVISGVFAEQNIQRNSQAISQLFSHNN